MLYRLSLFRVDFETFECWCRSESSTLMGTSVAATGSTAMPAGSVVLANPSFQTGLINTSNPPKLSADFKYLSFVSSSSQYATISQMAMTLSTGFSVICRVMFTDTDI